MVEIVGNFGLTRLDVDMLTREALSLKKMYFASGNASNKVSSNGAKTGGRRVFLIDTGLMAVKEFCVAAAKGSPCVVARIFRSWDEVLTAAQLKSGSPVTGLCCGCVRIPPMAITQFIKLSLGEVVRGCLAMESFISVVVCCNSDMAIP
ncbi:MAG: hypothetical protein ABTQ34_02420 [Bdellovibrionales bacterium]